MEKYICRMHTETTGLGVAGLCNVGTPPSFGIYSIDLPVKRRVFSHSFLATTKCETIAKDPYTNI